MTLNKESDKTLYRLSFHLLRPNYIAALSFIKIHDRNCPVHSFHPIFLCSSLCIAGLSYDYINTLIYFVVASDPPQIWDVDPVGFFLSFLFVVSFCHFVCLFSWLNSIAMKSDKNTQDISQSLNNYCCFHFLHSRLKYI